MMRRNTRLYGMPYPLLLALMIIIIALPACGPSATRTPAAGGEKAGSQQLEVTSASKVTEVIWYVREDPAEQEWEQEIIIPSFERDHPNIKINLIVASAAEFDTRMQTMITAGTPPDIWSLWGPSGFNDYVKRGLVADLTPYIERDKFDLDDFEPEVLDIYRIDGKLMGLPMLTTGSFIFYNKDLFDQAGVPYPTTNWDDRSWIWEEFLEKCEALTRVTGDPAADVYGCNLDLWPNDAYAWLWGKGLYPDSAYQTGLAAEANLEDPLVVEAFQSRQNLVWKYGFMPYPARAAVLDSGGNLFRSQKVAMQLTGGWGWWTYDDIQNFRWGVAALPYGAENRRDITFTFPWLLSSKTQNSDQAWEFMKFLASQEVQRSWMKLTGAPPARMSLAEEWYAKFPGMTPEEVKEVHEGAIKHGIESPAHKLVAFNRINQVVSSALEPVVNNKRLAADALPAADPELEEVLQQIMSEFQP